MASWELQSGGGNWQLQSGGGDWELQSTGAPTIVLVQSATATNTTGTSITATYPSATTAGNTLIGRVTTNDPSFSVPSGWTSAVVSDNVGDGDTTGIFYKIADGTETTVTPTAFAGNTKHLRIEEWSGLSATPLDVTAASTTSAGVTTKDTGTTGTIGSTNALIVTALAVRANISAESATAPFSVDSVGDGTFSAIFSSAIVSSNASQTPTNSWTTAGTAWGCTAVFLAAAGGGGTTFNQAVSGTITAAGSLVKQTLKKVAGTTTLSGSVIKQTLKRVVGSTTLSGVLNKFTTKTLSSAITLSSSLNKLTSRTLTGTTTIVGTLTQSIVFTIALSGAITLVGALAKQTNKAVAGSISLASTLTRQTNKLFSSSITLSGNVLKNTSRLLQSQIVLSGTLLRAVVFNKLVTGVLSVAGALATLFIPSGGGGGTIISQIKPFIRRYAGRR